MAGRTWTYYKKNPEAYKRKKIYDAKLQKRCDQVKKRVEANKKNRDASTYGNGDGLDYDHAVDGFVSESTNRGRKEKSRKKGFKRRKKKEKCKCNCKRKCKCRTHKKIKNSKKNK